MFNFYLVYGIMCKKIKLGSVLMLNKVLNTIEKYNMLSKGDRVIVALSGGPDSMSLLYALHVLKEEYNLTLYAAHINHMLRGKDSDNDERASREFCERYNIEFFSKSIDIDKVSKEKNISHEMAGREVRYEFFHELLEKLSGNKIALAHNLNDQAETVLMRIMRGSGVEGLVGIKPVRDNIFIRPLIQTSRRDIEVYCSENNLPVRIDKTNFENIYTRNKIRLEMLPYIESNFNDDIINTLGRMASLLSIDNEYLEEKSSKLFEKYCDVREEKVIIYKDAFTLHPAILNRVLRKAVLKVKGDLYNLESKHIEAIIGIQKTATGKFTRLPGGILSSNVYKDIHLYKENILGEDHNSKVTEATYDSLVMSKEFYSTLHLGENEVREIGKKIILTVIKKEDYLKGKRNETVKYFDFDKIKEPITLRFRKEGDRFSPLGMNGSKKIKDIFIDLKIPREKRDFIPLLCFSNEISWIIGHKVSDKFKIDKHTNNILEVKYIDMCWDTNIPKIERQEVYE